MKSIAVGTAMSHPSPIYCGIPHGSVLGPVLPCMYTMPMEDIILCHGLQCMMYARDIQLYATCAIVIRFCLVRLRNV